MALIKKGNVIVRTGLPDKYFQMIDRLERARVQRLINPPLITRDRCRFCGKPLKVTDEVKPRRNGPFAELYAHSACYKREVR